MVNLVITLVFVAFIVGIWILRNTTIKGFDKQEKPDNQPAVIFNPDEIGQMNVHVNNEPVNVQATYPDSDIETVTLPVADTDSTQHDAPAVFTDDNGNDVYEEKVDIVIGDEIPENSEHWEESPVDVSQHIKLDSSIDYANIADYFAGKLNTVSTDKQTLDVPETEVLWTGKELEAERDGRTIILADELIAGEAYVYYRQNMNLQLFKGLIVPERRIDEDYKNGVVRTRYARQAINGEYKRGFLMRSAEIGSMKFYAATKDEIVAFLRECPETKEDLAYILGPYKDKYV